MAPRLRTGMPPAIPQAAAKNSTARPTASQTIFPRKGLAASSIASPASSWLNIRRKSRLFPAASFKASRSFGGRQGRSGPNSANPCNRNQNDRYIPAKMSKMGTMGETPLVRCMARQYVKTRFSMRSTCSIGKTKAKPNKTTAATNRPDTR